MFCSGADGLPWYSRGTQNYAGCVEVVWRSVVAFFVNAIIIVLAVNTIIS